GLVGALVADTVARGCRGPRAQGRPLAGDRRLRRPAGQQRGVAGAVQGRHDRALLPARRPDGGRPRRPVEAAPARRPAAGGARGRLQAAAARAEGRARTWPGAGGAQSRPGGVTSDAMAEQTRSTTTIAASPSEVMAVIAD